MKKVVITGKVTLDFKQILIVPDDEVSELLSSEENLIHNIDLDNCTWDAEDFREIKTETFDYSGGYAKALIALPSSANR